MSLETLGNAALAVVGGALAHRYRAQVLAGGFPAWEAAGLPLEEDAAVVTELNPRPAPPAPAPLRARTA